MIKGSNSVPYNSGTKKQNGNGGNGWAGHLNIKPGDIKNCPYGKSCLECKASDCRR